MATIVEAQEAVAQLVSTLTAVDLKLDEIKTFISGLQANQPVTQAQLDDLVAAINAAKTSASAVLTETDALDV